MTKKVKTKSDGTEKKPRARTKTSTTTKSSEQKAPPIDLAEVRKDISNIVGSRATELAKAVMEEGKKGQLAPVKYLFEVSGLYPASESAEAKPDEESLAHTLMHKLNLPELPIESEDDEAADSGIMGSSSPEEYGKKDAARNADSETGAGARNSNEEIS